MSCHPKCCKGQLLVLIMKQDQYMLVKILFLQDLPPEVCLKFSGYFGTTQQLMNEADSYVITLRQEKRHKHPVSVASHKQGLPDNELSHSYEAVSASRASQWGGTRYE